MSTSILPSSKSLIVIYKNNTNNDDADRDSGGDSGGDSDGVNEDYIVKITYTHDESSKLVNYETKLVFSSLPVKISTLGLKPGAAIYFEFT